MRVSLTADHNGVGLKRVLVAWLTEHDHLVDDRGVHDADRIVDYPALCADAGRAVTSGRVDLAVVVGGSGQGEVVACNKVRGVRAGLAHTAFAVDVSRGHNDANVMVLGAKVVDEIMAVELLARWLAIPFKGGRHQDRVDQISALEQEW